MVTESNYILVKSFTPDGHNQQYAQFSFAETQQIFNNINHVLSVFDGELFETCPFVTSDLICSPGALLFDD